MYGIVRHYSPKKVSSADITAFKRRIEENFVPIAQEIPGFHSYVVLNSGDKDLFSISVFESREGATESTRRAAQFVQQDPIKDQVGKPEVFEGEVLVLRESGAGVGR
jgi:hypothetical protein